MSIKTSIEYCDSSANLMMGCSGCELWSPSRGIKRCYAGVMTERFGGGNTGFPNDFNVPELFLNRLDAILKWKDLTGTERPDKPWLNGLPRVIFLNDMGDTFAEGLPDDWFSEPMMQLAQTPHIYLLLTKLPSRMQRFSERHPFPANFRVGTSVTSQATLKRKMFLEEVHGEPGMQRWLSVEPMVEQIDLGSLEHIDQVVFGGESETSQVTDVDWIKYGNSQCIQQGVAYFNKQLGSIIRDTDTTSATTFPEDQCWPSGTTVEHHTVKLKDPKGGDMSEWPECLRVRQVPPVTERAA